MAFVALTHSRASILRRLIITLGQGVDPPQGNQPTIDWTTFTAQEPARPDNCIKTYDTTGSDDGRHMIDGQTFHHYGTQIRVRGRDQRTTWLRADQIKIALEKQYNSSVRIDSSLYIIHCLSRISQPIYVGKD